MIKNECKHEWDKHTGVKADGKGPYYICNKCKAIMEISEVIQLETLEHLRGFQKWMSIIAICVAVVSLVVSILVAILK